MHSVLSLTQLFTRAILPALSDQQRAEERSTRMKWQAVSNIGGENVLPFILTGAQRVHEIPVKATESNWPKSPRNRSLLSISAALAIETHRQHPTKIELSRRSSYTALAQYILGGSNIKIMAFVEQLHQTLSKTYFW
jgi:hypothetical protein